MIARVKVSVQLIVDMLLCGRTDVDVLGAAIEDETLVLELRSLAADLPEGDAVMEFETFTTLGGGRASRLTAIKARE